MKIIRDLLSRDLDRKIEEIIQVDQDDEQAVYTEITEYIATDSIRDQYSMLLKAVAEAHPTHMKVSVSGSPAFSALVRVPLLRILVTPFRMPLSAVIPLRSCSSVRSVPLKSATCLIRSMPGSLPKLFFLTLPNNRIRAGKLSGSPS